MAYMSQENKAELLPTIKALLKRYGMVGSVSVHHHSTLVVKLTAGALDLIGNYNAVMSHRQHENPPPYLVKDHMDVNPYWVHEHFTGRELEFIVALLEAMDTGNHDRSEPQTDYFDVGWYRTVKVGAWDKPYQLLAWTPETARAQLGGTVGT